MVTPIDDKQNMRGIKIKIFWFKNVCVCKNFLKPAHEFEFIQNTQIINLTSLLQNKKLSKPNKNILKLTQHVYSFISIFRKQLAILFHITKGISDL